MLSAYKLAQEQSALLKEDASQTSLGIPESKANLGIPLYFLSSITASRGIPESKRFYTNLQKTAQ